ncbi:MAG TPA: rhomboid family intramembrane serine protease [Vicinamibacterales bacterium]
MVRALIWTNAALFVISWLVPAIVLFLGLQPDAVYSRLFVWQPVTYMFLHAGFFHILFNMLALWMFGVELERMWGTTFFLKYYFVTGVGAAVTTMLLALVPGEVGAAMRYSLTVGASGAIYGLLLAYALAFPDRPIYMWMVFPIPARYFVLIMGAIAFLSSVGGNQGGVANTAHLGGLVFGYLYLRVWRSRPLDELKYRYVKWRMNRLRRKFSVYSGGRNDWDRKVH